MAANDVRIGIIGAGGIAIKHLEVLDALPGVHLAGIVSRTRARAESVAAQFDVSVFDDIPAMVDRAQPDALMVLVSAGQIADVARRAMDFGLPLFIEKPAGLTPAESGDLARLADTRGVRTMVGYNRRHYSVFQSGREIIGRHGPLLGVLVEGHERIDAVRAVGKHPQDVLDAWLYANATHTIDLLRFFGGEVTDLHCVTRSYREPLGDQFGATLAFESGAIGHYVSHWLSPGGWRVVLYGSGATVEFKPLEAGRWTDGKGAIHEIAPSVEDQRFKPGFYAQMQAFLSLVRDPQSRSSEDLRDAYKTMQLAERMALAATDTKSEGA